MISSFRVKNNGYNHITPDDNLMVSLAVTYKQNGMTKSISITNKDKVIVPYGGDNLVFFKWKVPEGTPGCQFKLVATVNQNAATAETNYIDNTTIVYRTVESVPVSSTPDTKYESKAPSGFLLTNPPVRSSNSSMQWSIWEWENNWFSKMQRMVY